MVIWTSESKNVVLNCKNYWLYSGIDFLYKKEARQLFPQIEALGKIQHKFCLCPLI
jgi:hypothetical protein